MIPLSCCEQEQHLHAMLHQILCRHVGWSKSQITREREQNFVRLDNSLDQ